LEQFGQHFLEAATLDERFLQGMLPPQRLLAQLGPALAQLLIRLLNLALLGRGRVFAQRFAAKSVKRERYNTVRENPPIDILWRFIDINFMTTHPIIFHLLFSLIIKTDYSLT
jgi:hypothetical protein